MNIFEQIVDQTIGLKQNIEPVVSTMAGHFSAALGSVPLATIDGIQAVAWLVGIVALLLTTSAWLRTRRQLAMVATRLGALEAHAAVTDSLLAETSANLDQMRQRAGQLSQRQETAARSGLRQAIVLSRHGATARQIMDTCGLSQGEVHLIHTLYGRSHQATAGADAAGR